MAEKMTIHRALSELKVINARIEKGIVELEPVGLFQKGKLVNRVVTPEAFAAAAQSKFDSTTALIDRKSKIKAAIVMANAITTVTVGGKDMTIADAITFKASIVFNKKLIDRLKARFRTAIADLNKNNDMVNGNVQKIIEATFGREGAKVSEKDVDAVQKPYLESNEWHLFDPLGVEALVTRLEKEITDFETDIDAVLSEVNATTFIEF